MGHTYLMKPDLPTGTVTFLFTDIEGSTRLWDLYPAAMRFAMARHDELIEGYVDAHNGVLVRPRGEGDSRGVVREGVLKYRYGQRNPFHLALMRFTTGLRAVSASRLTISVAL